VTLTNDDQEPLLLQRIETNVPWAESEAGPLRLAPGESASVALHLRPERLAQGVIPPLDGRLAFILDGRGEQSFPLHVETVRRLENLDGPLLVDPGPPRVVLARPGPRPAFLRCSGDQGLEPHELGLTPESYGSAVYAGRGAVSLLLRLLDGARAQVRKRDELGAGSFLVVRQPWFPVNAGSAGLSLCDWASLAANPGGMAPPFVRVDCWTVHVCPESGASRPVTFPRGVADALGARVLRCAARHFGMSGERSRELLRYFEREMLAAADPSFLWLMTACEALLTDYRWGPAYAWGRLLAVWREHLPVRRGTDVEAAHHDLSEAMVEYFAAVCRSIAWRVGRTGEPRHWGVLSSLFGSEALSAALETVVRSAGFEARCAAPRWADWLRGSCARIDET